MKILETSKFAQMPISKRISLSQFIEFVRFEGNGGYGGF